MIDKEFQNLIAELNHLGHERYDVECKGAGRRDEKLFLAKVVRAVLGMANRRDGGVVLIGVEDDSKSLKLVGLGPDVCETWKKYDDVLASINEHADPSITLDLSHHEYDKKNFVVLTVHEFEDVPVLCKKDHPEVLRKGACYVRSRRKIETAEIPSQEDMRDLLTLAIEKGIRKWTATATAVGLRPSGLQVETDHDGFNNQYMDFLLREGDIRRKIITWGYWDTIIRPTQFIKDRMEILSLYPLLQEISVQHGGFAFPRLDYGNEHHIGLNWIWQEMEIENFLESWKFCQSGFFADRSAMWIDWQDRVAGGAVPNAWKPGEALGIAETVLRFTAIFEFAARLAISDAGDERMHIEVKVVGLKGRRIWTDYPTNEPFGHPYRASIIEYPHIKDYTRSELVSRSLELALEASRELFGRFGWDASLGSLRSIQSALWK